MSLDKRRINKIKNLKWIEARKQKRLSQARKEKNRSKTSIKKEAKEQERQ